MLRVSIQCVRLQRKRVGLGLRTKLGLKSLHVARNRHHKIEMKFEQLIIKNIIKIDATRRQIIKLECTKIDPCVYIFKFALE